MKAVNPLTLLLIFASLIGYIALSIWFVFKNEQKKLNRIIWICLILGLPFLGSTIYFLKYFIDSGSTEISPNNTP
ncbi:hypothetical protein ES676_05785 [Bizionia saleffrena]|uniref:Cardiolipin synthase N-terminal domain-containing protein n=1 Tax=Bizionia saleffrena TaxID=291189 RepID=A0A8H2QLS6_9FLAO|nr:PLDc N-terminal domain-containing protein [Bizionia saleffrena]TYB75959.1 hypothetical protein ES676_05785 [Bizionia saleffrena]